MPQNYTSFDHQCMAMAIKLAQRGQYTTSPNPNVGCVIVKNSQIIAQGWHKKAGFGHAEVNALSSLTGEQSQGATAYVTLEPCSHFGRTPPCAKRLIEAGITKVFIAMLDTNPQVSGRGVKMLQDANIDVEIGLLEQDARAINLGFFSRMENNRPFVQVKMASSLDGKVALENGKSKWITGANARSDVQRFRALSCAIISTATTVLTDNASLNVRASDLTFDYPIDETNHNIRQPVRVILDSKNQLSVEKLKELSLFSVESPILLIRKKLTNEFQLVEWINEVEIEYGQGFDLSHLLTFCAEQGFNNVWVEAGSTLAASFIEQELCDQLILYVAPKLMGKNSQELLPVGPFKEMEQVIEMKLFDLTQVGSDIRLTYELLKNK